jgi:hypothetical protein
MPFITGGWLPSVANAAVGNASRIAMRIAPILFISIIQTTFQNFISFSVLCAANAPLHLLRRFLLIKDLRRAPGTPL